MKLSDEFKHAGRESVAKGMTTNVSQNTSIRQSYETNPDGTRKWVVERSGSSSTLCESFEEAMAEVRGETVYKKAGCGKHKKAKKDCKDCKKEGM